MIIKKIAEHKKLTIAELAKSYGYNRQYLYKLNESLIGKDKAKLLAKIYKDSMLSAEEFLKVLFK
jgi:hypothetical protein